MAERFQKNSSFFGAGPERELAGLSKLTYDEVFSFKTFGQPITRRSVFFGFQKALQNNKILSNKIELFYQAIRKNHNKGEVIFLISMDEIDTTILIPLCHWLRSVPNLKNQLARITSISSFLVENTQTDYTLGSDGVSMQFREISRFSSLTVPHY